MMVRQKRGGGVQRKRIEKRDMGRVQREMGRGRREVWKGRRGAKSRRYWLVLDSLFLVGA